MTALREAVQEFVADSVADNDCKGCGHFQYYAERFRAALAQPDMHPQCAQGCEFLAMEQRRIQREATLKERGFE
jgi:hypothetical protein